MKNASVKIVRDGMMDPMLVACPSFVPQWDAFLTEWVGNPVLLDGGDGSLPIYLALSDLANHLIAKLERGATEDFPSVFRVVERWIGEGDAYVSEAAVLGLVEDLSGPRYTSASPEDMKAWLGPQARQGWDEVVDFWDQLKTGKFRPLP